MGGGGVLLVPNVIKFAFVMSSEVNISGHLDRGQVCEDVVKSGPEVNVWQGRIQAFVRGAPNFYKKVNPDLFADITEKMKSGGGESGVRFYELYLEVKS